MSYSVRHGKLTKRKFKTGDALFISIGRDPQGQWWWFETATPAPPNSDFKGNYGGPFATKEEADRDSQVTLLGPQCEIRQGGDFTDAIRHGGKLADVLLQHITPEVQHERRLLYREQQPYGLGLEVLGVLAQRAGARTERPPRSL